MKKLLAFSIIFLISTLLAKSLPTKRLIQINVPVKVKNVFFFYRDSAFSDAVIRLSNLQDKDALITKEAYLSTGTIIRYSVSYAKEGRSYTIKKSFIVPETTDTIKFQMDIDNNIHIKSGLKFFIEDNIEILHSNPLISLNINKNFLDNMMGRSIIDSLYQRNKIIADNMKTKALCTKNEYHILSTIARTDYYFRLLYWAKKNNRFEDIVNELEKLNDEKEQIQSVTYSGLTEVFSNYFGYIIKRDQLDTKNIRNIVNSLISLGWHKGLIFEFITYSLEDKKIEPAVATEIYGDLKKYLNGKYEDKLVRVSKILIPKLTDIDKIFLITVDGGKLTLKQLMEKNPNKFLLIDFWASWCKPCREQAPFFESNKQQFLGKNIVFTSLSLDEDDKTMEWKKALKDDGLINGSNQYKLIMPTVSPLFKNFKISAIPRYALINAKGEFVDSDFLMPSDIDFMGKLSRLITEKD